MDHSVSLEPAVNQRLLLSWISVLVSILKWGCVKAGCSSTLVFWAANLCNVETLQWLLQLTPPSLSVCVYMWVYSNLINLLCVPVHAAAAAAAVFIFFCLFSVQANCGTVRNKALNTTIQEIRVEIRSVLEHLVRLLMLTKIIRS